MPVVNLPAFTPVSKNSEEMALNEDSFVRYNGYINERGVVFIRPGFQPSLFVNNTIIAAYPNFNSNGFVVIDQVNITLYEEQAGSDTLKFSSSDPNTITFGTKKPIYTSNGSSYFIATGARIAQVDGSTSLSEITAGLAPTISTHVAWIDGYLLSISGSNNQFVWSNLNAPATWGAFNFASASGSGDPIVALWIVERQIYLIGSNTTEVWENNGVDPFARVPGGFIEVGCSAPYSVVRDNDTLYWISDKRTIVKVRGRTIEKISTPYDKVLSNIDLTGCIADKLTLLNRTFLVWQFPTAERTIVYEPATGEFLEFGEWDTQSLEWLTFNYKDAFFSPISGKQYILTTRWNSICFFRETTYADKTAINSTETRDAPIKFLHRTGFINHDTHNNKRCNSISMRIKRGSSAKQNAILSIRFRNDNTQSWSNDRTIDLGKVGETNFIRTLFNLGMYAARQYEFEMTDAAPLVISEIKEDYTKLG